MPQVERYRFGVMPSIHANTEIVKAQEYDKVRAALVDAVEALRRAAHKIDELSYNWHVTTVTADCQRVHRFVKEEYEKALEVLK